MILLGMSTVFPTKISNFKQRCVFASFDVYNKINGMVGKAKLIA
jgi:hypothetical protein